MTTTRMVVSSGFGSWQPKTKRKTNINTKIDFSFGASRSVVLVVSAALFSALTYLYFVNSSAVKGFEERSIEKEMLELQKESEQLKIREAELKSLYYIEESSKKLNMAGLQKVSYAQEQGPVALNR